MHKFLLYLTSTATAIIITRSNTDEEKFASKAVNQLIKDSKSLILVGIGLILFGFVPGFPTGILTTIRCYDDGYGIYNSYD